MKFKELVALMVKEDVARTAHDRDRFSYFA
jgi:hypothetical protein